MLAENVVGEYTGLTIPYVDYAIVFATSEQGALLVLSLPGVLLVAYSVFIIWRSLRKIDKSKDNKLTVNDKSV